MSGEKKGGRRAKRKKGEGRERKLKRRREGNRSVGEDREIGEKGGREMACRDRDRDRRKVNKGIRSNFLSHLIHFIYFFDCLLK